LAHGQNLGTKPIFDGEETVRNRRKVSGKHKETAGVELSNESISPLGGVFAAVKLIFPEYLENRESEAKRVDGVSTANYRWLSIGKINFVG
jgi:hypothetical protein